MGTWGEGAFDNDTAADRAWEFDGADLESGMRLIEAALGLAAATPVDGYLSCQDGDLAVAAAELVAYIAGEPVDETAYDETALGWAGSKAPGRKFQVNSSGAWLPLGKEASPVTAAFLR